jgi:hypothetical protein
MQTKDVRRRAADLVGDRARQHAEGLATQAEVVALRSAHPGTPVIASDVTLMMVLLNIAGTAGNASDLDAHVDAAGHAGMSTDRAGYDA